MRKISPFNEAIFCWHRESYEYLLKKERNQLNFTWLLQRKWFITIIRNSSSLLIHFKNLRILVKSAVATTHIVQIRSNRGNDKVRKFSHRLRQPAIMINGSSYIVRFRDLDFMATSSINTTLNKKKLFSLISFTVSVQVCYLCVVHLKKMVLFVCLNLHAPVRVQPTKAWFMNVYFHEKSLVRQKIFFWNVK